MEVCASDWTGVMSASRMAVMLVVKVKVMVVRTERWAPRLQV